MEPQKQAMTSSVRAGLSVRSQAVAMANPHFMAFLQVSTAIATARMAIAPVTRAMAASSAATL